jgi:hypothetical protein
LKHLQNLSYKTLFIILILGLAGIVFFLKIGSKTQKVSAAWWDSGWIYRQYYPVNNTSGSDQTNFVVKINLDTGTLITANKMQNTCNDIRATDSKGILLSHFVTQCNTSATNIYVEVPLTPSSGTGIYLYYGNSSAPNIETSSIFTYFEGFDTGTTLSAWTTTQVSVGVTSGFANKGSSSLKFMAQGSSWKNLFQTFTTSNDWSNQYLEYEFYSDVAGSAPSWATDPRDSAGTRMNSWQNDTVTSGSWSTFSKNLSTNTYQNDIKSIMYFTGNDSDSRNIFIDSFRIRKCTSTVTIGSPLIEEQSLYPIAYWKFDEGSGATAFDSSANQKNMNLSNVTWEDEDKCISGKCIYVDGTSSGNNPNLDFDIMKQTKESSSWTLSVWAKPDGSQAGTERVILGRSGCHGGIYTAPNDFRFAIKTTGCWTNAKEIVYTPPNMTDWHYLVAVYSNRNMSFYVDGKLVGSDTFTDTMNAYSNTLYLGGIGSYTFKGFIDEAKVYNYARTTDQIKQDYNSRGTKVGSSSNLGVKSNTAPSLSSKLVAYWKFDENSGNTAFNSSSNQNNGILSGSTLPTWTSGDQCVSGKCLRFNGNSFINTGIIPSLNTFSLGAWIKAGTDVSDYRSIIDKSNGMNDRNFWLALESGVGKLSLRFSIAGVSTTYLANTPLNDNKWHYVTATYDNSYVKLYVDGKSDMAPVSKTGTPDSGAVNSYIGDQSGTRYFNGFIDEVKIYNSALTDTEIKMDYNQKSTTTFGLTTQTLSGTSTALAYCIPGDTTYCANPVGEWNFEENSGTMAKDTSGNNNNGTWSGNGSHWISGKTGSAGNFNGTDDYIDAGTSPQFNFTGDYTISAWLKSNYRSSNIVAIGKYSGSGDNYWFGFDTGKANVPGAVDVDQQASDGNWHYVTGTCKSGIATVFVDGVSKNTGNCTTPINPGGFLGIGKFGSGSTYYWKGSIDQVRIYNYARTQAQIAYDFNRGQPVAHWKFDECQGSIVHDSSSNHNNGTVTIGSNGIQNSLGTCQSGTSAAWTNGASGKYNASLNFDGTDDYVSGTGTSSISNLSNGTASFWINTHGRGFSTGNNQEIKLATVGNRPYIYGTGSVSIYWPGASNEYPGSVSLPDNQWIFVTVVWQNAGSGTNNGLIQIYYNAILQKTLSNLTLPVGTSGTFYLGGIGTNSPLNGQMDDVRIYNYALTLEQIKQLYNNGAISFQ